MSDISLEEELIIKEVKSIRSLHPVLGTRKLQVMLEPFLLEHQIKIGRDALFDLLAANKLLIKRIKRRTLTTYSSHWLRKYSNLIKGKELKGRDELWVSDITYWKIASGFIYISFITDAYTHKIVGYHVSESMDAASSVVALKMALEQRKDSQKELIHHSDRGVQYCSSDYVKLLQDSGISISMTESGDPLENAIAERMNGIMKEEYLNHYRITSIEEARLLLAQKVGCYNDQRPHMSCSWLTPAMVHHIEPPIKKVWKSYYRKNNLMKKTISN